MAFPVFDQFSIDLADVDSLEAFYRQQTNTDTRFMQLNPGSAVLNADSVDFGDIRVLRVAGDGRHLWTDNMLAREWRFAIMTHAEGGPKIGQHGISRTTGHLLRPGQSSDLITNGRYNTLEITFDQEIPEVLGWECRSDQTAEVENGVAEALTKAAETAFMSGRTGENTGSYSPTQMRSVFLDLLELALRPWMQSTADVADATSRLARTEVVRSARLLLQDDDFSKDTSVTSLAREIGMSKRSVFLAFSQEYGVGPRKFRELVRLNALRANLYRADPESVSVTLLANEHGFSELGRMAGRYRALFGELPSETLKRRKPSTLN